MEASEGLGLSGPDSPRLYQMIKDEILDGEPVDGSHQDTPNTQDDHRVSHTLTAAPHNLTYHSLPYPTLP
ncbi:hypothetical protein E2C01_066606 [Portunus trituberculatus]|uniref:Uncharacterized protein n=1 Tax=Portunus trituberculatus TaxID=210409 RepID=A0A5B7HSS7_PORTR|nr:hypothetical protein [Portunus trituberculatus]